MKLTKFVLAVLLTSTIGAMAAMAQQTLDTATVDLTSLGTTTVTSLTGVAGTISAIGCVVTTPVTGTPGASIEVTINGNSKTYTIYSGSNTFVSSMQPFEASVNSPLAGGAFQGDSFLIPYGTAYGFSLTISVFANGGATTGMLTCSALR